MTHAESREKLSPVQKKFCKEYVIDFNGAAAYKRASSSNNMKSCSVQASKLLKLDKVNDYIRAYVQEQLGPQEKHLLGNVKFWIEVRDNQDNRLADRMKASENLAKYEQMFIEKKEINVEGQVKIVDDIS